MNSDFAVVLEESDDLVAGDRQAVLTTEKLALGEGGEVCLDGVLGLIGYHGIEPVGLRVYVAGGENLDNIATVQPRFYGSEEVVEAGIFCMKPELRVDFEGKVEHSGFLREHHGLSFWCEGHDVVVVERCSHIFEECAAVEAVISDIPENRTEFLNPSAYIVIAAVGYAAQTRVADHTFAADMHFLPASEVGEQLHVEALVAVFLGRVDVVCYAARFFLESVGEDRVYAERHVLLGDAGWTLEHDFGEMAVFEVVEVVAELVHLAPDAVWLTIFDVYSCFNAAVLESFAYFVAEYFETFGLSAAVAFDEACQFFIFMRASEAETEVFELCFDVIKSEAVCQRCIEIVGLAGDFHLLVGAHR